MVAAPTFYEQCLEVTNAKYFPGRAFAPGYLSTQAACQGYVLLFFLLTQVVCACVCVCACACLSDLCVRLCACVLARIQSSRSAGGRCTAYDDPLYDIFYTEAECAAEATQRGTCQLSNCIGCDKVHRLRVCV